MTEQSQLGSSKGWPAAMYHRLQCSATRVGISGKWLILFGEIVVNENGFAGETGLAWTITAQVSRARTGRGDKPAEKEGGIEDLYGSCLRSSMLR